ncbi:MAG TPA: hypothetical protein VFZ61_32360 [Polyangiales bacterium]
MRLRLLLTGLSVAVGACDATSLTPASSDAAAAHVADADTPSAADDGPDATPTTGTAQVADAARLEDTSAHVDAAAQADAATEPDAAALADAGPRVDAGSSWKLGMNDVTILAPLPTSVSSPVLLRGTDVAEDGARLVPKDLFDRLGGFTCFSAADAGTCPDEGLLLNTDYENLHLVAVRFDLCDRTQPGICAAGEDAGLRLVWQPVRGQSVAFADAGIHAFFAIPHAQLPSALTTLRELAQLQGAPVTSPLLVSPALSDSKQPAYAEKLRAFVRAHALRSRLVRLAMNVQPVRYAQVRWLLRGLERQADGTFRELAIPGSAAVQQDVFARGAGFEGVPAVDLPAGFSTILRETGFQEAAPEAQVAGLQALVDTEHPLKVAPGTAPCITCHTSTPLYQLRINPFALPVQEVLRSAYVTPFDVSIDMGKPPSRGRSVRGLGYVLQTPVISRRVAHETAQVLTEIAQRFP